MKPCLRTLNSFYLKLFKGKMGFERKREDGGKGRAERETGLETGRSRGRNFLNYKSDLEKQCVGLVGLGGDVQ